MSLFERLLARGSGELPAVRPRLLSLFETTGGAAVEEIHVRETPESVAPAPAAAVSDRAARPEPKRAEDPRPEPPPAFEIHERRIVEKPVPPAVSKPRAAPSLPPSPSTAPLTGEAPEPWAASGSAPETPRASEPPELSAEPTATPIIAPPPVVLGPEPPSLGPLRPAPPVEAVGGPGADREPRPAAPILEPPAPAGPPRVDVRIGHIEVRAIEPPAAAAPRAVSAPRRGPRVSLDDYLRRRRSS